MILLIWNILKNFRKGKWDEIYTRDCLGLVVGVLKSWRNFGGVGSILNLECGNGYTTV